MSTENPDFSLAAKKQIARATRLVLRKPANNADAPRPANPRSGGGVPVPQYVGDVLQAVAQDVLGAGPVQAVNYP